MNQLNKIDDIPVNPSPKTKLTIPIVSAYLNRGYNQVQIANACNVSRQAVSQFISVHHDRLIVLGSDDLLAHKYRLLAHELLDSINPDIIDQASLKDRLVTAGIATDKDRLLSGQATAITVNVSLLQDIDNLLETIDISPTEE